MRLIPSQPKVLMPRLWSVHDLALIPLRNQQLFTTVVPSKIFEAMATGTPVLMSVPEGEATRLVRTTACGVLVPPEDPQAMADAIVRLEQNPDERARFRAAGLDAASQYSRDKQAALMLHVLESVCGKPSPAMRLMLHAATSCAPFDGRLLSSALRIAHHTSTLHIPSTHRNTSRPS